MTRVTYEVTRKSFISFEEEEELPPDVSAEDFVEQAVYMTDVGNWKIEWNEFYVSNPEAYPRLKHSDKVTPFDYDLTVALVRKEV